MECVDEESLPGLSLEDPQLADFTRIVLAELQPHGVGLNIYAQAAREGELASVSSLLPGPAAVARKLPASVR